MKSIKYNKIFKILSCFVIFVFLFEQIAFSADRTGYRYDYSQGKSILTKKRDLDQASRMSPVYLQNAQRKHEQIIQTKNMVEENLVYFLDNRSRSESLDETMPLKRRVSTGHSGQSIKYTLSDFDNKDQAQQISVYSYREDAQSLERMVSYDIRDMDASQWTSGKLEEISEKGEEKVLGSFIEEEYGDLCDELKLREVVYCEIDGKDKIDYSLSEFINGKATEISIYDYSGDGKILKEAKTYDVSLIFEKYNNVDLKKYMEQENQTWKNEVKNNSKLIKETVYETKDDEDRIVYALSEKDKNGLFRKLNCYDYANNGGKALKSVRTYNIQGENWNDVLSDFRSNDAACRDLLTVETIYTGEKDKEVIDYVLSGYSRITGEQKYEPIERSNYTWNDRRCLTKIDTYRINNSVEILQRTSEFSGVKGHEIIKRSYDYGADGVTLGGVNVYEYDLEKNVNNLSFCGDGNKYTLDKMTRYVGVSNPQDLTCAKKKSETYYSGLENQEDIMFSFGFNSQTGVVTTKTQYIYEEKALRKVNTYQIPGAADIAAIEKSALVACMTYGGIEGQEKAESVMSYDLNGEVLGETLYNYDANGVLQMTTTYNSVGAMVSQTVYEGHENLEKRSITKNYDLQGNMLTTTLFEHNDMDILEKSTTVDAGNTKIFETIYDNIQTPGKASLVRHFDKTGMILSTTSYEYDSAGVLKKAVNKTPESIKLSETIYAGIEDYESVEEIKNYDLAGELITTTKYEYLASGALNKTLTYDTEDKKLSETTYAGEMNREKVTETKSYDLAEGLLTLTKYEYLASGALNRTVTYDTEDRKLSETTYAGQMNQEKVTETKSYDLAGGLLTLTKYEYSANGALNQTVTYDTGDTKLSETTYTGQMNQEKVTETKSYDLAGRLLTLTKYEYQANGALNKTLTYDTGDRKLSETTYAGQMNQEKVTETRSYDLAGGLLTLTKYEYQANGALSKTLTYNAGNKKLSETTYTGQMNQEKVTETQSYDLAGELITTTKYEYSANGALSKTLTYDTGDRKLSETTYAGQMNQEKVTETQSYDLAGGLLTLTKYEYQANGALTKTLTYDTEDRKLSETTYTGQMNQEKVTETRSYDLAEGLLTLTKYEYQANGALTKTLTYDT
ncbi:MAG: hypothetical protein ABIH09_01345, partial [Candidatus Omnitrophota bacterium]